MNTPGRTLSAITGFRRSVPYTTTRDRVFAREGYRLVGARGGATLEQLPDRVPTVVKVNLDLPDADGLLKRTGAASKARKSPTKTRMERRRQRVSTPLPDMQEAREELARDDAPENLCEAPGTLNLTLSLHQPQVPRVSPPTQIPRKT